jgi:hypothetical protein
MVTRFVRGCCHIRISDCSLTDGGPLAKVGRVRSGAFKMSYLLIITGGIIYHKAPCPVRDNFV